MNVIVRCLRMLPVLLAACSVPSLEKDGNPEPAAVEYVAPRIGERWVIRKSDALSGQFMQQITYEVESFEGDTVWLNASATNWKCTRWGKAKLTSRFVSEGQNDIRKQICWTVDETAEPPWPISVGQRWEGRFTYRLNRNSEGYNEGKWTAEAYEAIEVPAGRFETIRVRFSGFWTNTTKWDSVARTGGIEQMTWYERSTMRLVKRRESLRFSAGQRGEQNVTLDELVELSMPAAK